MTVHTTISIPARRRRGWLVLAGVAAAATIIAGVVTLFVTGGDTRAGVIRPFGRTHGRYNSAAMATIMALTPTRLAAGALGLRLRPAERASWPDRGGRSSRR